LRAGGLIGESPETGLVGIETCGKGAMSAFGETVLDVNDVVKLNDGIVTSANEVLGAPIGEDFGAGVVRVGATKSVTEECATGPKIS
jgi:hypothetical protein